jgi:hypothetical protein
MWRRREQLFELWAPSTSVWSVWCKPVLFAHLSSQQPSAVSLSAEAALRPPPWAPPADGSTAIVLDLPGARSVHIAMLLAQIGFRPVLLFNAAPAPDALELEAEGAAPITRSIVDVQSIVIAVEGMTVQHAPVLQALVGEAPPVFVLDADRWSRGAPRVGDFDNRSLSLSTDFPSATFLASRGISRVLLVAESETTPQNDLVHTLRRWQEAGVTLVACVADAQEPRRLTVARPSWFRAVWHNALSVFGLKRHPRGGFGGTVEELPLPSSG